MGVARRIVVLAVALAAAGCASDGRDGPPPGLDDDGGPPRARVQLFISPSGQPFRAPGDQPYPSAAWLAAADADRDGRLTRAEFRADAEAFFMVVDADGDGQLSMPEATTRWEEELVPEMSRGGIVSGAMGRPGGGFRGRNELATRTQGAALFSLIAEPHPLRAADTDFDFKVTKAEWRAAADRRFALLDSDGDGAVLAVELGRTPAQNVRASRPSMLRREAIGPRR